MATNYPIFRNQKQDVGDDYQITFAHPFGAAANIDQAWIAVRNLERSPSQTVFETLETTFAKFNFATDGIGVVTIAADETDGKTPGFYQYDIQMIGTPQEGDFDGAADTTLTVLKGDWQLRPNAASGAETSLLLSQWERAYCAVTAEYDARVAQYDDLDERISTIIAQSGTSDTEVVDSRDGYTVLNDRLDAMDVARTAISNALNGTNTSVTVLRNDWNSGDYDTIPLTLKGSGNDNTQGWPLLYLWNPSDGTGAGYDGEAKLWLQAGATANERRYLHYRKYDGSGDDWIQGANAGDAYIKYDADALTHREWLHQGGNSDYAAAGAGKIRMNYHSADTVGYGGFEVFSGGSPADNFQMLKLYLGTPGNFLTDTTFELKSSSDSASTGARLQFGKDDGAFGVTLHHYLQSKQGVFALYDYTNTRTVWAATSGGRLSVGTGLQGGGMLYVNPPDASVPLLIKAHTDTLAAMSVQDSSGTTQFGIRGDGRIMSNLAAANTNTPSGATAYAHPIYNATGTLLGYFPIYASAW